MDLDALEVDWIPEKKLRVSRRLSCQSPLPMVSEPGEPVIEGRVGEVLDCDMRTIADAIKSQSDERLEESQRIWDAECDKDYSNWNSKTGEKVEVIDLSVSDEEINLA